MSSTEVEYSDRIQSAQEQTREERICEKVSMSRSRIVGRSFGFVSMISRTKNTCRSHDRQSDIMPHPFQVHKEVHNPHLS